MLVNIVQRPLLFLLRKMSMSAASNDNIVWVDLEVR